MAKYASVSREVRDLMIELTPQVEPLSIDEAFMDLAGTERLHGMSAAKVLSRFATRVERDIGITVSIGLAANKFLAKIASDLDKPRGFVRVLGRTDAACRGHRRLFARNLLDGEPERHGDAERAIDRWRSATTPWPR